MRTRWVAAAAAVLVLAGCSTPQGDRLRDAGAPAASQAPAEAEPGEPKPLTAADFELTLKIRDKECFGSAGCNVVYEVELGVDSNVRSKLKTDDRSYSITYEVTGPEDGAQIGTLEVSPDGTYSNNQDSASTPRSSTKLKVKITEVEMGL